MADVTLSNAQVITSVRMIRELLQTERLPVKLGYAAKKNLGKLSSEQSDIDEFRLDLAREYAEVDEEGNIQTVKDEDGNETGQISFPDDEAQNEFAEKVQELYNQQAELNLHLVDIDTVMNVELPTRVIVSLDWMFTENGVQ